jgi:D-3-phosphoglycerate dehydrogenase / 2-oxoglutarate reductase
MSPRILVTTTSFLDTPGPHVQELNATGFEIVKARGPLNEMQLLKVLETEGEFEGFIIGEDEFTGKVIDRIAPRAKVISRYGVGLDKIDLEAASRHGISVANTPGVNHTTVTEHTFGLLLSILRHIPEQNEWMHQAQWRRLTGTELAGKKLGILGFGRVGREVAKRAMAFGMNVLIYNSSWSTDHANYISRLNTLFADPVFDEYPPTVKHVSSLEEVLAMSDVISLHMNLTKNNVHFLNARRISQCKRGVIVLNVSRGGLIDQVALADAIRSGYVKGFGADVLEVEPVTPDNPLLGLANVHLTPHVGSRTRESVVRQGLAAVRNLIRGLTPEQER